jgi:hypothetical protein
MEGGLRSDSGRTHLLRAGRGMLIVRDPDLGDRRNRMPRVRQGCCYAAPQQSASNASNR